MSRVFNQRNVWGSPGGPNPQRADLWKIDFVFAVRGLNRQIDEADAETDLSPIAPEVEPYYIASVSLPSLKVKPEAVRRDSKPYMMPGFDEPMGEMKVAFVLESPTITRSSKIYRFLDTWRAFVRAGRGPMGNERSVIRLGKNFTAEFRYPLLITLLRGNKDPKAFEVSKTLSTRGDEFRSDVRTPISQITDTSQPYYDNRVAAIVNSAEVAYNAVENDLEVCGIFQIERAWLSDFRVTDLDYSRGNEFTKIEATFQGETIRDLNQP